MTGRTLVYLAGPPGAGKSTLMAALTRHLLRRPARDGRVAVELLHPRPDTEPVAVELGARRADFSGTDALPMDIQPRAVAWLAHNRLPLVLAEGDRLANLGFLTAAVAAGYQLHLVTVEAPPPVLEARAAARGNKQNPRWRAGRATKVNRLTAWAEALGVPHQPVQTAQEPPDRLAVTLRRAIPALRVLGRQEAPPGAVCCDMHNRHCEPPADLCCRDCAEAGHPFHPAGVACTWATDADLATAQAIARLAGRRPAEGWR